MELLYQEEQKIDLKVLHHQNSDDYQKKLKKFRRTVMAVYEIVSKKLYKTKSSSLETYFRDSWKISRAQVYRFLDCALVLEQLDGFTELPCRERLCRSLKRLAKKRSELRLLWETVLSRTDSNQELITSTVIDSVWQDLLSRKLVTGEVEPMTRREEFKNDMWAEGPATSPKDQVPMSPIGAGSSSGYVRRNSDPRPPSLSLMTQHSPAISTVTTLTPIREHGMMPGYSTSSFPPGGSYYHVPPPIMPVHPYHHTQTHSTPTLQWIQSFQPDAVQRSGLSQQTLESLSQALDAIYTHGYKLYPFVDGKRIESDNIHYRLVSHNSQEPDIPLTENLPTVPSMSSTPYPPYPTYPPPGFYYQLPMGGGPMPSHGQPGYWPPPPIQGNNATGPPMMGFYPPHGFPSPFLSPPQQHPPVNQQQPQSPYSIHYREQPLEPGPINSSLPPPQAQPVLSIALKSSTAEAFQVPAIPSPRSKTPVDGAAPGLSLPTTITTPGSTIPPARELTSYIPDNPILASTHS